MSDSEVIKQLLFTPSRKPLPAKDLIVKNITFKSLTNPDVKVYVENNNGECKVFLNGSEFDRFELY